MPPQSPDLRRGEKWHPPASTPTPKAGASGATTGAAPAMTVTTLAAAVPGPDILILYCCVLLYDV